MRTLVLTGRRFTDVEGAPVGEVPRPRLQRTPLLHVVTRSIVDGGDTANRAARVIQNLLDDVRGSAKSGGGGREGAPQVV